MALDQAYIDQITEDDFTPELTEALLSKVGNDRAKGFLTTKAGLLVKTNDEYEADKTAAVDTFAKSDSPRYYKVVDDFFKVLGGEYAKPDNVSTKQHIENLSKANKLAFTDEQRSKLEKLLKAEQKQEGGIDPKAQQIIDGLQKKIDDARTEQEKANEKRVTNAIKRDIKSSFSGATLPIPAGTADKDKSAAQARALDTINTIFGAKYVGSFDNDDEIFYHLATDKDKKPIMNVDTQSYATPIDIIKTNHSELLAPQGHQQQGGGTGGQGGQQGGNNGKKTKEDILLDASKLGLVVNSREWKAYKDEEYKKAGITK